jgi:ubiquinone/menaquinone biosynthesis C-methylase UbiE
LFRTVSGIHTGWIVVDRGGQARLASAGVEDRLARADAGHEAAVAGGEQDALPAAERHPAVDRRRPGRAMRADGYQDLVLARLYDAMNPWGPSDDFYLGYVMAAASVLDVGCGTGGLLARARADGHTGDLVGVDPAAGMLTVARAKRSDVDFVRATAAAMSLGRTFALLTMTGHAFQELLTDDQIAAALANFHRHLEPGGRLAFETRNPAYRAWERWTPELMSGWVTAPDGEVFDTEMEVLGVAGELVEMRGVYRSRHSGQSYVDTGSLRFVPPDQLRAFLADAGFTVEDRYGDWQRGPVTEASPEVIVIAHR